MNLFKIIRLFLKKISKKTTSEATSNIQIAPEDLLKMFREGK